MTPKTTPRLGQLLKDRREQLGYSRTRAAQLSGVKATTLETWEVGRVAKPPIHDVLRLARVLSISLDELERAVMRDEDDLVADDDQAAGARGSYQAGNIAAFGAPLLTRAIMVLDWTDADAAAALNTSPERVERLRGGEEELSMLEVLTLTAVLAAFPAGRAEASQPAVADLLARLSDSRV